MYQMFSLDTFSSDMNKNSRRVIKVGKKAASTVKRLRNSDFVTHTVSDVVRVLKDSLTDTTFLVFTCLSAWMYYQHSSPSNVVSSFLKNHQDLYLAVWALNNLDKVMGLIFFAPMVPKLPPRYVHSVVFGVVATVAVVPTMHLWVYMFSSVFLYLYIKCNRKSTRLMLAALFCVYFYYVANFEKASIYAPSSGKPLYEVKKVISQTPVTTTTMDTSGAPTGKQAQGAFT